MLLKFSVNGCDFQIGQNFIPVKPIRVIEIRTSGLPIAIHPNQTKLIAEYLWELSQNLEEDGYVLYNGIIVYKADIRKFKGF